MADTTSDTGCYELPAVRLILANNDIEVDYPNLEIVRENGPTHEIFNKYLTRDKLCLCLGKGQAIYNSWSLETLMLEMVGINTIKGVYSDTVLMTEQYMNTQCHPSWGPGLLSGNIIINSPMLIRWDGKTTYKDLQGLYHFKFLLDFGKNNLLRHCASPIFYMYDMPFDINKEIKECLMQ